jgi:hypothetical protein
VSRWVLGWSVGGVVVAIAASLLVTIIAFCRRIVGQAEDITKALDGARERTNVLFGLSSTNAAVASITSDLRAVREGVEDG